MMTILKSIFLSACVFMTTSTFATTWDEPWMDKVIKEADYFVFAKVNSFDEKKGVTIEIQKTLGGQELNGKIKITDFYLLDLCSMSGGHGPEFHFKDVKESFFFIKKVKGKYCIATPTSGFAFVDDSTVYATYRHSYHQALVPLETYEKTMTAIFNYYHNKKYDEQFINEFVGKYVGLEPAGFDSDEINTFFDQHVALECAYHLRLKVHYEHIIPFLADTTNFHNQVSAARALISYNTPECHSELLKVIADTTRSHFVQVMCVWTLAEFKPKEIKDQLIEISKTASSEGTGFGGNIMDPRVCTSIPNVKDAILELLVGL